VTTEPPVTYVETELRRRRRYLLVPAVIVLALLLLIGLVVAWIFLGTRLSTGIRDWAERTTRFDSAETRRPQNRKPGGTQ
jgi:type VI protein secretion system component VasF